MWSCSSWPASRVLTDSCPCKAVPPNFTPFMQTEAGPIFRGMLAGAPWRCSRPLPLWSTVPVTQRGTGLSGTPTSHQKYSDVQWGSLVGYTASSDEFSEIELMRVSRGPREGGQVRSSSPREPGESAICSSALIGEGFLPILCSLLTSAPCEHTCSLLLLFQGPASTPRKKAIQEKESWVVDLDFNWAGSSLNGGRDSRQPCCNWPPSPSLWCCTAWEVQEI